MRASENGNSKSLDGRREGRNTERFLLGEDWEFSIGRKEKKERKQVRVEREEEVEVITSSR
jgi:hypothetical protein